MQIVSEATIAAAPHYNETEVRFHILDQVIRKLGYPDTENTYLLLEEKLEYPYVHIGRRSKKDVPLGFADYRAGIKGARGSFVAEAKAGNVPISNKEVEQAHSYASHAQVGANFFVLCNGTQLSVYATLSGPNARPIVELPLSALNARFHEVENILSPQYLERKCRVEYDRKLRLGEGLGSSARIRSGRYLLSHHDIRVMVNGKDCTAVARQFLPQFSEAEKQVELLKSAFEMRISDGIAERGDDGKICARVEFSGATIHNQTAMAIIGVDRATFVTADEFISTNRNSPTVFESLTDFSISRGTSIPQFFGGNVEMEGDIVGNMFIKIALYIEGSKIFGEYIAFSDQSVSIPGQIPFILEMDMAGPFELEIDV